MAKFVKLLEGRRAVIEENAGPAFIPLAEWQGEPRVKLGPADDPGALAGKFGQIEAIAVDFPQFTDGRGFSIARLLRERYGFKGEIRAVGDVLRDTLFYLSRCGFDAFELKDQAHLEEALSGFGDFSDGYQASVERPQPLFRRRAA